MYARDEALIATPIGMVRVTGDDMLIDSIRIEPRIGANKTGMSKAVLQAGTQIAEYFSGQRTVFDLPLKPSTTPRGDVLRDAISSIPYANTISYGDLASAIDSSARAIGQACARNPFPIVIPCHRVTGAGGALGHYSAGDGRATKIRLLDHERLLQERQA